MAHAADADRLPAERHGRGERPARGQPAHGHGLLDPALVGQAVRLLRHVGAEGARRRRTWRRSRAAGARRSSGRRPMIGVVNPNSPLVWDRLMVDALIEWASANQPVVDHAVPAGRARRRRSAWRPGSRCRWPRRCRGVALDRRRSGRARRACSARSSPRVDMRSGGPALGTPGVGARHARRRPAGAPLRPAATAAAAGCAPPTRSTPRRRRESAMTLWATMLAGCDLVLHAAGWLEGGLTASYEKFALDLEVLRMFQIVCARARGRRRAARAGRRSARRARAACSSPPTTRWPTSGSGSFMSPLFRSQAYVTWAEAGRADRRTARDGGVEGAARELGGSRASTPAVDEELQEFMARRERRSRPAE